MTVAATVITTILAIGVVLGVLTAMVLFVRRVARPHRGDRGALR